MSKMEWQPIETAPKDGSVFDVWLGNSDQSERDFYCTDGGFRSPGWHWLNGKFRPFLNGLSIACFALPTHWMPLPDAPNG